MPGILIFHILHITWGINEPIKVADLQKLVNQLMLNGALVIKMVNNYFSESKKNFGRLIKRGMF